MLDMSRKAGRRLSGPEIGAIAVMSRRGGGPVGIVSGFARDGNPILRQQRPTRCARPNTRPAASTPTCSEGTMKYENLHPAFDLSAVTYFADFVLVPVAMAWLLVGNPDVMMLGGIA
jgi:hypothetical protein